MKKIWNLLHDIALKDNQITEEEIVILDVVMGNISNYLEIFDMAVEDGILTEEERKILNYSRDKIFDDAYKIAIEDNTISNDENEILMALIMINKILEKRERKY